MANFTAAKAIFNYGSWGAPLIQCSSNVSLNSSLIAKLSLRAKSKSPCQFLLGKLPISV